jgi:hypothetical protein
MRVDEFRGDSQEDQKFRKEEERDWVGRAQSCTQSLLSPPLFLPDLLIFL